MRASVRRLATATTPPGASPLQSLPLAILPPIQLYRRLFRAHRKFLAPEMRILGDRYIKSEFRLHQKVENPMHVIAFLTEWQLYAQQVEGEAWKGDKLDKAKVDKMSDQQIAQLYELMQEIRKREGRDGEDNAA